MPKIIDLTGLRFGRLSVLDKADNIKCRSAYLCRCDCGAQKVIPAAYLRHGGVMSCGCLRSEMNAERGRLVFNPNSRRNMPMYRRWTSIKQRCFNSHGPHFKNYGGRGVVMCDRWAASFDDFLTDMGPPPSVNHTVERVDNNGNYAPDNCRWAVRAVQLRNRRNNIIVTVGGESLIAKDWADRLEIPYQRLTYAFRTKGIEAVERLIIEAMK